MKNKSTSPAAVPPRVVVESRLAGSWYPANPATLSRELQAYLDAARPVPLTNICALIQPHAGYQFSGATAAYGMKAIAGGHYRRVVIIGPSHYVRMPNLLSVPDITALVTPLGEVPVDVDFVRRLRAFDFVVNLPAAHAQEHSVEIQVPLLQAAALKDLRIVPVVAGQFDAAGAQRAATALLTLVDDQTLVLISSDFTHYGPNYDYLPFTTNVEANLRQLDMGAFAEIERRDAAGFAAYCDRTGATICGRDPIRILLAMLPAGARATLLHYDTSGRGTGDFRNSVSYLSIAFTGTWPAAKAETAAPAPEKQDIPAADRQTLLKLARETIEYRLREGHTPSAEKLGIEVTPAMKQVMGAFVTLHTRNGDLRGCIGEIEPRRALYKAVIERAVDSALHDPRFQPVRTEELPGLRIEISALTPPHPVPGYKDIVIGKHGMVLIKGGCSAVFLPQVAPEQGWDLATTLSYLSMKAGLPSDAWREGAQFLVFEAIVFGEKK